MRLLFSLFLLAVLYFGWTTARVSSTKVVITEDDKHRPILDDSLIQQINNGGLPWSARRNPRFEGITVAQAKKMMGTRPMDEEAKLKLEKMRLGRPKSSNKKRTSATAVVRDFPVNFDSRTQWPGCVHAVLDQGQCGSCWAFGATESLSDRFCIETSKKTNVVLSPESLVSCDWEGNFGCGGGIPELAWEYMEWAGVLTLSCFPYTAGSGEAPPCASSCSNSSEPYKSYYAREFTVSQFWTAWEIQNAIYNDGPVEGTMDVYSDFIQYSSGVYVEASNATFLGGHAIKMVGWGHDTKSGLDYWIVQNSWGTDWGMNGFFWIQRGVDMCGIDDGGIAGLASI
jgi:cathepsin B